MSRPSQATQLVDLALKADVELFHTPQGEAYANLGHPDHRETWAVRSRGFRLWLARRYYAATGGTANAQATADALAVLEGHAHFSGPTAPVFTRVAEHDGTLYLDLADEAWRTVAITSAGWSVTTSPGVRFRRPAGMMPLPVPERGGSVDLLREVLTFDDDGWMLAVGYLVGALRPDRSFPILPIIGEPGSGKSTQGEMLRAMIDPNVALLRAPAREEIDLILQAVNGWIVGYDNLSSLPEWLTDALCRLSTGAGFSRRQLYTNDEESLFAAKRPILYTAVTDVGVRSDLADRQIPLMLPRLTARRTEDEVWAAFRALRPRALGALLDVVGGALGRVDGVTFRDPPRMHDFARFVTAAEPALGWPDGTFLRVYTGNREAAHEVSLEASAVGQALLTLMRRCPEWMGNAQALLIELNGVVDDATRQDRRRWPQGNGGPRALSGILRTIAGDIRAVGLEVDYHERLGAKKRQWHLHWGSRDGRKPSEDGLGTVGTNGKSAGNPGSCPGPDGRDGEIPTLRSETDFCWQCGESHEGACP